MKTPLLAGLAARRVRSNYWQSTLRATTILAKLLVIVASANIFSIPVRAQGPYCDDANPGGNADYYDMDSKCVHVVYNATYVQISAQFHGPQVPSHANPPACGVGHIDVVCRRICADLPKGKKPGVPYDVGYAPPGYALFDHFESFDHGDHYSVCYGVRNWANHGVETTVEDRLFAFKVSYQTFPPRIDTTVTPAPNANGWNKSDVKVDVIAKDTQPGGLGIQHVTYSAAGAQPIANTTISGGTGSIALGQEGVTTLSFYALSDEGDSAGPQNLTVKIDKTLPVLTSARIPPPNKNDWNNTDVTVQFSCQDALSGVAVRSPTPPVKLSNEGKDQFAYGTCSDLADNPATLKVGPVNIDKTPPVIEASIVPPPNEDHWNYSDVKVSFAATDSLSGVESVSSPSDVVTEGRDQPVVGHAEDRAGTSADRRVLVNLDKTPPESVSSFDAQNLDAKVDGTDSLSGVKPGPFLKESNQHHILFWVIESRKYTITDLAGNKLVIEDKLRRTKHSISGRITHLQYNDGTILVPPRNKEKYKWRISPDGKLTKLDQEFSVGAGADKQAISAAFNAKGSNETSIRNRTKQTVDAKPGLFVLSCASEKGQLVIRF